MKIKIISLCLFYIALSLSCKKEDHSIIGNNESLFLKQVIIDHVPSFAFKYNSANLITEEKGRFVYTLYHYNEMNQLEATDYYANLDLLSSDARIFETAMSLKDWVSPTKSNLSGTIKYEYNVAGQLIKSIYSPSSGSSEASVYTYDEDNRISRQDLYWEASKVGSIEYLYDTDGNLTEEDLYNVTAAGASELSTTTTYEYDNKQNPFRWASIMLPPGTNTNVNNVIKETQTIHLDAALGGDIVGITQNSYKYNTSGYPVGKNGNTEYIY